MKKTVRWLILGLVLLLLGLNKWRPWAKPAAADRRQSGGRGGEVIEVRAYQVKPQDVENEISATGSILANESVALTSEISGRVTRINFREGSRVRKGDLLLQINDAELQAQFNRASALLKLAQDTEARQKKQLAIEAISQEEYEAALNRLNTAKADVQLIQAQIDKARIQAPFDGVIGLRSVSEGAYLNAGSRIATLVSINPVKIDFAVPERYQSLLSKEQPVLFRVQGESEEYSGRIYAVEPQIDTDIRSVRCRALCPNPDGRIKPGAFAQVRITLQKLEDALMIPSESLIPDAQNQSVFVVRNGRAFDKTVVIGLRTADKVQIVSGLAAGDTVMTTGLLQVRPGSLVKVTELN
ncbi:MAG TPA: efflux RND transporter periplasmic adaptor subunit [bacterium]|nr:efflux RND transporter periplasmic adaptor subunit [bacterium]